VEDSGPGITAEQQDRLFEAFYTTKSKEPDWVSPSQTYWKNGASIVVSNRNGLAERLPRQRCLASTGDFMKSRILIVEDEKKRPQALSLLLTDEGTRCWRRPMGRLRNRSRFKKSLT
jgi:hypothetical protein